MDNPFSLFTVTEMARSINNLPNPPGRLGALGLFPVVPVSSNIIGVEELNGQYRVIPTVSYGSPGMVNRRDRATMRYFGIPKVELNDLAKPDQIQNARRFGSNEKESMAGLLAGILRSIRIKHDITVEYHRWGALSGIVYDADGVTPLTNFYTEFGITQPEFDFDLGDTTTEVQLKCLALKRYIEQNVGGSPMNGVRVFVDSAFFDKLVTHPTVKEAYRNYAAAQERLGGDMRTGFAHGGVVFEEVSDRFTLSDGTSASAVKAGEGRAIPMGTTGLFELLVAPADFNDTVNTLGQLYYVRTEVAKFGRGIEVHTQANFLPMARNPRVLVRVYSAT